MAFSTNIAIDGYRCIVNVPKNSRARQKANAIFCPLGPAPTQGWFLLLKSDLDALDVNAAHTVTWQTVSDDGSADVSLSFPGLYIVNAERLLHGGVSDGNALYLVEFADARFLVGRNSATGPIRANPRSYANSADYLTGSDLNSYRTWENLVSAIWTACGLFGSYPGLPTGLPIDGVPENTFLIGLNALRALTAVLDQLDCALCRDPFSNNFSIVQLGGTQTIPAAASSLKWNGEPKTTNSQAAAQLNVHFFYHHKAYGQERDTELNNNAIVIGGSDITTVATGISGANGTAFLWDDLPIVIGETGNQTAASAAAQNTRANNRKSRYVTRYSVTNQHRIHLGLLNSFVPGEQIRAVMWRNWDDGDENDLGGTVTEFICCPQLIAGVKAGDSGEPAWIDAQLVAPEREQYGPPDFGRHTFPNYPRLSNVVQVWHEDIEDGDTVQPDFATGDGVSLHAGQVRRWVNNNMATLDPCWILFVDDYDNNLGDVEAVQGEYYGPARLSGISTAEDENEEVLTLPVYVVKSGASQASAIVQVHHEQIPERNLVKPDARLATGNWVHSGRIRQWSSDQLNIGADCWIMFLDSHDDLVGSFATFQGQCYVAKSAGTSTINDVTRPLFIARAGDDQVFVKITGTTEAGYPSDGTLVEASDGVFFGQVVSDISSTDIQQIERGSCEIAFNDFSEDDSRSVITQVGKIFGPCKQSIAHSDGGTTIFEATIGEQEFHGKGSGAISKGDDGDFELYDYHKPPRPTGIHVNANVTYNNYAANKFARIHRDMGGTTANQVEL